MKKIKLGAIVFCCLAFKSQGQINWNIGGRIENAIERKVDQGIDRSIDKGVNEAEENIKKGGKKVKEGEKKEENNGAGNTTNQSGNNSNSASNTGTNDPKNSPPSSLQSYSKFDFIPGEKVIALEDFSQDAVGDFPAKWNTNGNGEIVTIDGQQGKWLKFGPNSIIYPEFINGLPENFTVEFNLACTNEFSYYSSPFHFLAAQMGVVLKEYPKWDRFGDKKNGMEFALHPTSAGGGSGYKKYNVFDGLGDVLIKNDADCPNFSQQKNVVKVSIWRQKTRFRMYVNDEKIWDIPKAFDPAAKYNFLGFRVDDYHDGNNAYFLSNLRVAVGAPDTRNKLITEGKYSTTGILFDVNSDKIKPESYGTLKEIAAVLTENPDVKIKIIGHTDSDGEDAKNLELSKKRSESVKITLNKDFGISLDRMQTDGKGETMPVGDNNTIEGKANNRRVEFIKL
jgi:outer membrane protein OmpA-like peptidoglycan-associated protein